MSRTSIKRRAPQLRPSLLGAYLFVLAGCQEEARRPTQAVPDAAVDGGGAGSRDAAVDETGDDSGPPDSRGDGRAEGGAIHDASRTADVADDRSAAPPDADPDGPDGGVPADAAPGASDAGDGALDGATEAGDSDAAPGPTELSRIVDWSVRKRLATPTGGDVLLEEMLMPISNPSPTPSRLVLLGANGAPARSWAAPTGAYISDFCVHPSGAASVVLVSREGGVSFVRLGRDLAPLGALDVHDTRIASDPHVSDAGALNLLANSLTEDAARIGGVGEDVVAAVFTSWNSVVAYRASFSAGAWTEPERTLVEPPTPLLPNLPLGGSFDTFGAMTAWFRCLLDVDEDGNTYVATWASPRRIRDHVGTFHDDLAPLPVDLDAAPGRDADVLLTKLDPAGARLWSRVVGTAHGDEPYALRARNGAAAVVGRARRVPGFDNTFWDVFIAVTSSSGEPVGARTIALDASSIALAVDSSANGAWVLGGSDGWSQNPDGLSILTFGAKLLLELPSLGAEPVRLPLPAGARHNEIRSVRMDGERVAFGGHEDGPITHTGDGDTGQIRATGVLGTGLLERR